MRCRYNIEAIISIIILSVINGFILKMVVIYDFYTSLIHCIFLALFFGVMHYIAFLRIYSKYNLLKENNKLLIKELQMDKLTELYNRRTFNKDIKNMSTCEKYSAIFIDIDNFRNFNNEYGHAVGDEVLKNVSDVIKNSIRKNDLAYRYGGEEIVVILKDCDKEGAFFVAEKIRNNVSSIDNSPYSSITISLGVSEYPGDGKNIEEVVQACDKALLYAKKNGKNRTVVFNENIVY